MQAARAKHGFHNYGCVCSVVATDPSATAPIESANDRDIQRNRHNLSAPNGNVDRSPAGRYNKQPHQQDNFAAMCGFNMPQATGSVVSEGTAGQGNGTAVNAYNGDAISKQANKQIAK